MGNKKNTKLINNTDNVMEIRVFRGLITGKSNNYVIKARQQTDIGGTKYDGSDRRGGQLPAVMIFCDGRSLLNSSGDLVLPGEEFFSFKTVTIGQSPEDQNSTGVVNYEFKFEQPRDASGGAQTLKVFSDSVLNHDNGWSVQHCENGIVKLTRKEGMTMTLDPSKLFASNIVPDPETPLLNVVLKFWPGTFADLICKDDLGTAIGIVNYLMRQAKVCHVDESKVEVDKVVQKVDDLHKSCAAMVEWYRPLFPKKMKDRFPHVVAEVDPEKLEKLQKFETTIKDMLRNS